MLGAFEQVVQHCRMCKNVESCSTFVERRIVGQMLKPFKLVGLQMSITLVTLSGNCTLKT